LRQLVDLALSYLTSSIDCLRPGRGEGLRPQVSRGRRSSRAGGLFVDGLRYLSLIRASFARFALLLVEPSDERNAARHNQNCDKRAHHAPALDGVGSVGIARIRRCMSNAPIANATTATIAILTFIA